MSRLTNVLPSNASIASESSPAMSSNSASSADCSRTASSIARRSAEGSDVFAPPAIIVDGNARVGSASGGLSASGSSASRFSASGVFAGSIGRWPVSMSERLRSGFGPSGSVPSPSEDESDAFGSEASGAAASASETPGFAAESADGSSFGVTASASPRPPPGAREACWRRSATEGIRSSAIRSSDRIVLAIEATESAGVSGFRIDSRRSRSPESTSSRSCRAPSRSSDAWRRSS